MSEHARYSSKSIRSDEVFFHHQTNHTNGDVKLRTNNNFNIVNPIKCQEYIINDKYKLITSGEDLVIQKNNGSGVYNDYMKLS